MSATGGVGLSKRKATQASWDWFGVSLSPALVCQVEKKAGLALAPAVEEAQAELKKAPQANFDETGFREEWKPAFLWVGTTPKVTVFQIDGHRNREAFEKLAGGFQGIAGSDRYSVYAKLPVESRQVCWAHLIRDFRSFLDRGASSRQTGEGLGLVAQAVFHAFHKMKAGEIPFERFQETVKPYQELVHGFLEDGRLCPDEKTANTCENLLKLEKALWTFTRIPGLEPTNNAAERALRPAVIHRKTSFGTQSEAGSRFRERVMTVVATLKQNQRDVMGYLNETLQAWWNKVPPPSLFPQPAPLSPEHLPPFSKFATSFSEKLTIF